MTDFADIMRVYMGSDGEATKALYRRLESHGPAGFIATNLFRACKCSERAKVYRGGGFRGAAYDRKQWSMDNLVKALTEHAPVIGIAWGWGEDPAQPYHRWVLYVEIPSGQVSFHTAERGEGPDYGKPWDGIRDQGPTRICRWIVRLLDDSSIGQVREDEP